MNWNCPAACLCAWFFLTGWAHAETLDALFQRIPEQANAIAVVEVVKVLASQVAQAEGWKQSYADEYSASPLMLPPDTKRAMVGMDLDVDSMTPRWEAASLELRAQGTVEELAEKVGGVTDILAKTPVVWIQDRFCVAQFSSDHVGILTPTTRQNAARWIRQSAQPHDEASPYLEDVLQSEGAAPLLMAIDLQDLLRPQEIRQALSRSQLVPTSSLTPVAELLAGIEGVTLTVSVDARISGQLHLDFADNAAPLAGVAKPLLLAVLRSAGAMIDEFSSWDVAVEGKRVTLQGALSSDGIRRLFSVFSFDSAGVRRAPQSEQKSATPLPPQPEIGVSETSSQANLRPANGVSKYRTLNYYKSVTGYLKDLQKPQSQDFSEIALWIHSYARRIERLSTKEVDPDLVSFAGQVVYQLDQVVSYLHGTVDQTRERTAAVPDHSRVSFGAVPTGRVVNYGGFRRRSYAPMSYSHVDVGAAQRRTQIATDAADRATSVAQETMQQIKSDTEQIYRQMRDRYGYIF